MIASIDSLDRAWRDYLEAKQKADVTGTLADRETANGAWANFISLHVPKHLRGISQALARSQ